MQDPRRFGATVRCRLGEEEGFAATHGDGLWAFQPNPNFTRAALWRDLKDVEIVFEGVER